MARKFYKVSARELRDTLKELRSYETNTFNNSFSVWKNHSYELRLFTKFLGAAVRDADKLHFDHDRLRGRIFPTGAEHVYISHTRTDAKTAYLLKSKLERKDKIGCLMSGDAWEGVPDVARALREQLKLPQSVEEGLAGICSTHLRKLMEEYIAQCGTFIFVMPPPVTPETPYLDRKYLAKAPWLEDELTQARSLATRKAAPEGDGPDLTFLKYREPAQIIVPLNGM